VHIPRSRSPRVARVALGRASDGSIDGVIFSH